MFIYDDIKMRWWNVCFLLLEDILKYVFSIGEEVID